MLGNKQIYNSNCIQQFNYGTREKGFWKKFSLPLSTTSSQTLMLGMKNLLRRKKDHDELEAFFNYFDIMFHHMSSSADGKNRAEFHSFHRLKTQEKSAYKSSPEKILFFPPRQIFF